MASTSSVSMVPRNARSFRGLLTAFLLLLPTVANAQLIISEFRLRGPNGANDEFIEIHNNSDADHTVVAVSGAGYGVAASDGTTRCSIPNGTVIPGRGHYLCVNSVGYSLASYPAGNGTTAAGDAAYTTDIPDNAGIAIFNNDSGGSSYSLTNRFDAVGSTLEANTVYREATGYGALAPPLSLEYSFARRRAGGCTGSGPGGNCTTVNLVKTTPGPDSTQVVDTNNNAADFMYVDPYGTNLGAGQRLGAPGPENLSSPVSHDGFGLTISRLDPCRHQADPPNLFRDAMSYPDPLSSFGRLEIRSTFTNTTAARIMRLRFRIIDITTLPSISGVADLRPMTSSDVVATVDRAPCSVGGSTVTVHGTTVEQPPNQPNGAGFNGTLSVGAVAPGTPLAAGASIDVRFLFGILQGGAARFCVAAETLPATSSQVLCYRGGTETGTYWNSTAIDFNYGPAFPYPSSIFVSGFTETVTKVTVTIKDLNHTSPPDVDVLLVGPTGVKFILMSDVGGVDDWTGQTYTFDSAAAGLLPQAAPPSGVFQPTNYGAGDTFAAPAPAGPYLSPGPAGTDTLAVFNGLDPNGTWSLYLVDDSFASEGVFGGGWELTLSSSSRRSMTYDFNGDATPDIAVFRPSTGVWFVRNQAAVAWGAPGDIPVAGDYNGDGTTDRAVYRPSTGVWWVHNNQPPLLWGAPGDIPVPGDYNGARTTERAVYRPSTGVWYVHNRNPVQWGIPGDVPVPGDYDGDFITDIAVYRPSSATWFVLNQASVVFGAPGDVPVAGDYNGDGKTDRALYRPSTSTWFIHNQGSGQWGLPGDIPVPADYNNDGITDIAVYRPSAGTWLVEGQAAVAWGIPGDLPVVRPEEWGDVNRDGTPDVGGYLADFNGDGATDIAVYRESIRTWYAQGQVALSWGLPGDIPVPGDYNGNGPGERAVYSPTTGMWSIRGQDPVQWGLPGDVPVPGDYNGNGSTDIAVYTPATGTWWFQSGSDPVIFGGPGDVPVIGDYNGNGAIEIAVYRPSTGVWWIKDLPPVQWGAPGDIPVPADYNADGVTDVAVFRPSTGQWFVMSQFTMQWGAPGDIPLPGDFDQNGTTDIAVYRPSTGQWFVKDQTTTQWGIPGDIPASRAYAPGW